MSPDRKLTIHNTVIAAPHRGSACRTLDNAPYDHMGSMLSHQHRTHKYHSTPKHHRTRKAR
jgi:hypothetical protein